MNFEYSNIEAVHIKVKKCVGGSEQEFRKFSVDPQITSYNVLRCLLSRAFDLHGDFSFYYMILDNYGGETYLPLLSDWDLDAAFISASDPCLTLKLHVQPPCEVDSAAVSVNNSHASSTCPPPVFSSPSSSTSSASSPLSSTIDTGIDLVQLRKPSVDFLAGQTATSGSRSSGFGGIISQMQNTWSVMLRSLVIGDDQRTTTRPLAPPLHDGQFRNYLDTVGRLVQPKELRVAVFRGGVEPTLRKVVWKHLLNVYPDGLSGCERVDYIRRKSTEYKHLRDVWMYSMEQDVKLSEGDVLRCTGMVKKDVLRTDRHVSFFSACDDNTSALFNLLTTYAVHHPSVGYVQGMSDLASPLLYVMRSEAQAYICFCALMRRLRSSFTIDGIAMTTKFEHLAATLRYYDPELFSYLKHRQADDLLFCYRWLLLELKREFVFDDTLCMLEVLWSSLQPCPPDPETGLPLHEAVSVGVGGEKSSLPNGSSKSEEAAASVFGRVSVSARVRNFEVDRRRSAPARSSVERASEEPAESDDRPRVFNLSEFSRLTRSASDDQSASAVSSNSQSSLASPLIDQSEEALLLVDDSAARVALPSPERMADGNPFLIFMCLSLLRQQRSQILSRCLDYQEIGMLFDRLVRQNDLSVTLHQARSTFTDYLKHGWQTCPSVADTVKVKTK